LHPRRCAQTKPIYSLIESLLLLFAASQYFYSLIFGDSTVLEQGLAAQGAMQHALSDKSGIKQHFADFDIVGHCC
jgi:hypothetical protein